MKLVLSSSLTLTSAVAVLASLGLSAENITKGGGCWVQGAPWKSHPHWVNPEDWSLCL